MPLRNDRVFKHQLWYILLDQYLLGNLEATQKNPDRIVLIGLLLAVGLTVFLVQMTFVNQIPHSLWIRIGVSIALLILAFFYRSKDPVGQLGKTFYLFFTASIALISSTLVGDWVLWLFNLDIESYIGLAMAKFSESVPLIAAIFILTSLMRIKPNELYVQIGKLKHGLIIGALFFAGFTAIALLTGNWLSLFHEKLQSNELDDILKLTPWILVFCLSNGFMEELLFRGLFLKHFESLIGFRSSNILTALIFSIVHIQVSYPTDMIGFLIVVFLLGLLLGNVMKKTNSIIGPTLIHAGADVLLILPWFSNYI